MLKDLFLTKCVAWKLKLLTVEKMTFLANSFTNTLFLQTTGL